MNHTTNYQLSQWEAEDRVTRERVNADNAAIDTALKANADAVAAITPSPWVKLVDFTLEEETLAQFEVDVSIDLSQYIKLVILPTITYDAYLTSYCTMRYNGVSGQVYQHHRNSTAYCAQPYSAYSYLTEIEVREHTNGVFTRQRTMQTDGSIVEDQCYVTKSDLGGGTLTSISFIAPANTLHLHAGSRVVIYGLKW